MSRIAVCMCNNCNRIGTVKIPVPNRGKRFGYMCDFHARNTESYYTENNFRKGSPKVNEFTISWENETSFSSYQARGEMLNFGFLPTHDGTVDVEYKSPIYEGLNAISKQLVTIEKLKSAGHIQINSSCGSHIHIGHKSGINAETMRYLIRFYHSLFIPLSDYMITHPEETTRFWGRSFNGEWARPINANSDAEAHRNFINMEHAHTVEFRLAKFQNAEQYMNVIKFCRDVVNALINNFIEHFNDTDFDTTRYENQTAYRKHKAQVTANKIVKLYQKYTENI